MAARIAYGPRDKIWSSIESEVIPKGSLIITRDDEKREELFFYDTVGELKKIHEREKFLTFTEAEAWAKKYECAGSVFSVHNGTGWSLYLVQDDGTLAPIDPGGSDIDDVTNIDGGTAFGLV